ncbi:hypothetical protein PG991_009313 [Apiospora marii]|uniref:Uncharacterized protein n=1 Tax=Apiospora marii TaxID=335849 RepID=A0ABR1RK97_9PEZI
MQPVEGSQNHLPYGSSPSQVHQSSLNAYQSAIAAYSPTLPEADEDSMSEGTVALSGPNYDPKVVSSVGIAPFKNPQLKKARELALLHGEDPATIKLPELQVNRGSHPVPRKRPRLSHHADDVANTEATNRLFKILRERSARLELEMLQQAEKEVDIAAIEEQLKKVTQVRVSFQERIQEMISMVRAFAHESGVLENDSRVVAEHGLSDLSYKIYLPYPCSRTIHLAPGQLNDNFLRPVEWILWNPSDKLALVVIPEEAEILLETIRRQERPNVHLILYAAPANKSMRSLGDLTFYVVPELPAGYTVPRWLAIELGVFAGRLYIDYGDYAAIRDGMLDVYPEADSNGEEPGLAGTITATNPTAFLLDWLTLRRRGQDILHTPMGYLCQGRTPAADHYLFAAVGGSRNGIAKKATQSNGVYRTNGAHDIDDHGSEDEEEEHEPRHVMIPEDSN